MAGFYLLRPIECERAEDGSSSLGDFIVAVSGKGLVAMEFGSHRAAMEDALRVRFPECDVTSGQDELIDILKT